KKYGPMVMDRDSSINLETLSRRWIELFSDYDCEIRYLPGKANVVANALSRKEGVKPKRVRAMNMNLQSSIKDRILTAQKEDVNKSAGLQKGADKMYYDLRDRYWYPGMKKDIAIYVKLFSDYDCEIRYLPGKANVVANALSRKEGVKPKRVRAMNMNLQSSIKDRILTAQKEDVNKSAGLQKG
nr:hypothetical protein [Tanacetum cinerariifolium]